MNHLPGSIGKEYFVEGGLVIESETESALHTLTSSQQSHPDEIAEANPDQNDGDVRVSIYPYDFDEVPIDGTPANYIAKSKSSLAKTPILKHRSKLLKDFVGNDKNPIEVSFWKLKMEVPDPDAESVPCASHPRKTILNSVTGVFEPGKFTAIMGSSGAGKTTLLNAVAGEAAGGVLSGAVRFNGAKVDTATIRRLRAFVFQDDVVMGTMTAYEAISMSAKLRLPPSMSLEEKVKRVEQVIEILQLDQCKDNVIGYPGEKSGVSGGERKRINIAMELITNPSVLFLDEPTSGLDTHTAHSVCKTLKELAAAGRTVVATIHQPSSDIFHMFDNLLLLANGQILYQGPSRLCMDYFAQRGSPCPQFTNPADHIFMKVLNDQLASSELERQTKREKISELLAEYAESLTFKEMEARLQVPGSGVDKSTANFSASLLLQMSVLFNRAKNNAIRNRLILRAKVGQSIFMGLLVGLIYRDLKHNQKSIQDRTGALFFISVNVTMSAMMTVITAFGVERIVFERERSIGMYSTFAYFLSKIIVELPHNIIFPFIQANIVYFLLELQLSAYHWITWCVIFTMLNNVGNALGICLACTFKSLEVTVQIAPVFILPLTLFSGFFVNQKGIPVYFDWIKYISPMRYSFQAFMLNEYTGLKLKCDDSELVARSDCPLVQAATATSIAVYKPCFCPVLDGAQVLKQMGMTGDLTIWENVGVLLGLWCGFILLAFLLLHRLVVTRERQRAKLLANDA